MRSFLIAALVAACGGGGSSSKDASLADASHAVDSQGGIDSAPVDSAPIDSTPIDSALVDAALVDAPGTDSMVMLDAPAQPVLKVKNYLSWCSVIVNGGTASTAAEQDVTVAPGMIDVSAIALTGFELGPTPWHDTLGDTGAGDPGMVTGSGQTASSAAKAVVGANGKCVWVCCPFTNGLGCPTADQCP